MTNRELYPSKVEILIHLSSSFPLRCSKGAVVAANSASNLANLRATNGLARNYLETKMKKSSNSMVKSTWTTIWCPEHLLSSPSPLLKSVCSTTAANRHSSPNNHMSSYVKSQACPKQNLSFFSDYLSGRAIRPTWANINSKNQEGSG